MGVLSRPGTDGTAARSWVTPASGASAAGAAWPAVGARVPSVPVTLSPPGSLAAVSVTAPVTAGFVTAPVGGPRPPGAGAASAEAVPAPTAAMAMPSAAVPAALRACFMVRPLGSSSVAGLAYGLGGRATATVSGRQ